MMEIPLTDGKVAIVDNEDFEFLSQWKWRFHKGYADRNFNYAGGKRKCMLMHRVIAMTPDGMETDHINGNKLDNRRCNLRVCYRSENRFNQGKYNGDHHSQYKGVTWHKTWRKWQAQIRIDGKTKFLGKFDSEIAAALAFNEIAKQYHGEFAKLNEVYCVD